MRQAVQAVLDGKTSTLDLEGLSLHELPHALLHLSVDAVVAKSSRLLTEEEGILLRGLGEPGLTEEEAVLLRGLGEPGGREAVSAYLNERAARRVQLLGDIDAAQAEALEGMAGNAAARVWAVLRGETATLRLAGLGLSSLPAALGRLQSLKLLDLRSNQLAELPAAFGQLQSLKVLNLSDNQLTELPEELGSLAALEKLDLDGNPGQQSRTVATFERRTPQPNFRL